MSNNMGTQNASVYWTGYEIHSCLKIWATKISCVLDKGYNSKPSKTQPLNKFGDPQNIKSDGDTYIFNRSFFIFG